MKRLTCVMPLMCGCGLAEVQNERAANVEFARAVFLKVVDRAKIDHSQIEADGQVVNPEYIFHGYGGPAFVFGGSVQAVGVDIKAGVRAAGVGEGELDEEMRNMLWEILNRRDINEQERYNLILRGIFAHKRSVPESQPTSDGVEQPESGVSPTTNDNP